MNIAPVPATPLEAAIQDVRIAQAKYDEANETYERLHVEISELRVRRDASNVELIDARERLCAEAVKPTQYVTEPIRVAPSYITEDRARIEEGVDAAWSDKGPEENQERVRLEDMNEMRFESK